MSPIPRRTVGSALIAGVLTACLAACSTGSSSPSASDQSASAETSSAAPAATSVTIEDNHGSVEVPVNPKRVVALDNHVFQTLSAWNVDLVAAPKSVMAKDLYPNYMTNDDVIDIGSHREPKLENIVAADPDLIITGYRFSDYYDDIKSQNPDAVVIEINPRDDQSLSDELKRETTILGQIFSHEDEATALNTAYDQSIASAKSAYNGTDTVMGLTASGGKLSYIAPVTGRSVGPVFQTLDLTPAIDQAAENTTHGDDISVEAIAQANPQWLIVLDRDAAISSEDYTPAKDMIKNSEALANVPAVVNDHITVLDKDFYLTEDIQAYTTLYSQIADAFKSA